MRMGKLRAKMGVKPKTRERTVARKRHKRSSTSRLRRRMIRTDIRAGLETVYAD
jgi:hypothetical protein